MSERRVTTLDMKTTIVVVFVLLARAASAEILDGKRLEQALLNLPGTKLDPETATTIVTLSHDLAKTDPALDPFILLAQIYTESRFDPTATSRLVDGARQTGPWTSRRAPARWSGNLYCGIAQNQASTWAACLALREAKVAMAAQAAELRAWLLRARGDLPRALASYGCGNLGAKTGRCNGYPQRVLALAGRLRRATNVVPLS
jgi:hypothetical protein